MRKLLFSPLFLLVLFFCAAKGHVNWCMAGSVLLLLSEFGFAGKSNLALRVQHLAW